MGQTNKGLKTFTGNENFDVNDFNNTNMTKIDSLLICDMVVDTSLPTESDTYKNKTCMVISTKKLYKCLCIENGNTPVYKWVPYMPVLIESRTTERNVSQMVEGIIYANLEEVE